MLPKLESIASVGFAFQERMSGTYRALARDLGAGELQFEFEVRCDDVTASLTDTVGAMAGHVTMTGVADRAPAKGTIAISPVFKRRIRYTFSFDGEDGHEYEFDGRKRLSVLRPLRSWTTLEGTVRDTTTGEDVAEAVLRFDLRGDLLGLLLSFRPAVGRWNVNAGG